MKCIQSTQAGPRSVANKREGFFIYNLHDHQPIFGNLANFLTQSLRAARGLRLHVDRDSNEIAPAFQGPI